MLQVYQVRYGKRDLRGKGIEAELPNILRNKDTRYTWSLETLKSARKFYSVYSLRAIGSTVLTKFKTPLQGPTSSF